MMYNCWLPIQLAEIYVIRRVSYDGLHVQHNSEYARNLLTFT